MGKPESSAAARKATVLRTQIAALEVAATEARSVLNIAAEVAARRAIVDLSHQAIDLDDIAREGRATPLALVRAQRRRAQHAGSHVAARDLLRVELEMSAPKATAPPGPPLAVVPMQPALAGIVGAVASLPEATVLALEAALAARRGK